MGRVPPARACHSGLAERFPPTRATPSCSPETIPCLELPRIGGVYGFLLRPFKEQPLRPRYGNPGRVRRRILAEACGPKSFQRGERHPDRRGRQPGGAARGSTATPPMSRKPGSDHLSLRSTSAFSSAICSATPKEGRAANRSTSSQSTGVCPARQTASSFFAASRASLSLAG